MPGLAVAREVLARGWTVSWLGTRTGMENRLVPPSGIPLDTIDFAGVRGKGLLGTFKGLLQLASAFGACKHILRSRNASAVLGMGGYVCVPGGKVARRLKKPLVLVNRRCGAAAVQQVAAVGVRPHRVRLRRRRRAQDAQGARHGQSRARRDRGDRAAGRALRQPRRAAARAAGGRQPGRQGAQRDAAAGAQADPEERASARHAPDRREALGVGAGRVPRARHRGGSHSVHRRHGAPASPTAT